MGKSSPAKHIRTLVRRRDTLAARIGNKPGPDDFDRGEHAALEWALPILKERSPAFGGRAPSPGAQLRPVDVSDEGEPEGACLDDPDGQHHVGCGCP